MLLEARKQSVPRTKSASQRENSRALQRKRRSEVRWSGFTHCVQLDWLLRNCLHCSCFRPHVTHFCAFQTRSSECKSHGFYVLRTMQIASRPAFNSQWLHYNCVSGREFCCLILQRSTEYVYICSLNSCFLPEFNVENMFSNHVDFFQLLFYKQ